MCGIAGFVSTQSVSGRDAILRRMTATIAHRGPDADGLFVDQAAALGHRRLSIIDLSDAGRQPMTNEDGSLQIVYNGEVFNHSALRRELERAGHRYRSHCDTETLLHAYEEHGPACVESWRGMFALAIWDASQQRLFGARDRLGIKPFYYYFDGKLFAFASEVKALLAHPAIPAALDESALPEYLAFGFGSSERTLFQGIRKLMPGHRFTLNVRGRELILDIERYWDVPPGDPDVPSRSESEWTADLRQRLEETVEMRLLSDVPLGAFLSGGVDSSAITALMKRHTRGPIKTYSVGYAEAAYSELGYARQVADYLGTEHHEVRVNCQQFFAALPKLIWHEDEPITWPSSVSLYYVSKRAAEDVKVVLTGEGSDELFGGYERYRHYLWNQRWMKRWEKAPDAMRGLVRQQVATSPLLRADLRRKLGHTFLGRENTLESLQLDNFYCALSLEDQRALLPDLTGENPYTTFRQYWEARQDGTPLAQMLYADQKTYLVELLKKQDRMSMATSIESRVPLLDHTLVEFAARIPDGLKIHPGGESKYIFKKAVEDLLPREIVYRKKMGFPTPLKQWLREGQSKEVFAQLQRADGLLAAYVDRAALKRLLEQQAAGEADATDRVWRLLNLQIWGDLFVTGKKASMVTQ